MTTSTAPLVPAPATAGDTFWTRVAGAAVATATVNVALALGLREATGTSSDFAPLQPLPVALTTAAGVAAVGLLLRALRGRVGRPERLLAVLVTVGALLSLGGPLSLLGASPADQPGVTDDAALALIPLHLVAAAGALAGALGWSRLRAARSA